MMLRIGLKIFRNFIGLWMLIRMGNFRLSSLDSSLKGILRLRMMELFMGRISQLEGIILMTIFKTLREGKSTTFLKRKSCDTEIIYIFNMNLSFPLFCNKCKKVDD